MRLRRLFLAPALALAFASLGIPSDAANGSAHSTSPNEEVKHA
jgi:hypothetical protein